MLPLRGSCREAAEGEAPLADPTPQALRASSPAAGAIQTNVSAATPASTNSAIRPPEYPNISPSTDRVSAANSGAADFGGDGVSDSRYAACGAGDAPTCGCSSAPTA